MNDQFSFICLFSYSLLAKNNFPTETHRKSLRVAERFLNVVLVLVHHRLEEHQILARETSFLDLLETDVAIDTVDFDAELFQEV